MKAINIGNAFNLDGWRMDLYEVLQLKIGLTKMSAVMAGINLVSGTSMTSACLLENLWSSSDVLVIISMPSQSTVLLYRFPSSGLAIKKSGDCIVCYEPHPIQSICESMGLTPFNFISML